MNGRRLLGNCGIARIVAAALAVALGASQSAAETRVKFSLDSRFEGPVAPFLVAIDKGYFKAEGLDVIIDDAPNPAESINRVVAGGYDMAVTDINALIRFRDTNPGKPVKAVFIVTNRPAYAIISRKSRGVAKPKDLEGKTLGAPAADMSYAQWKIFTQANGIDAGKVKIENVGVPVREPMLQNGQVDAVTGLSFSSFINLKTMGVPLDDLVVMLMADYGVNLYGDTIIVGAKFAADHPDAVKGFLRALVKGLREAVRDPADAVESVLKRNDGARKSVEVERLRMAIKNNIVTPEVKANGYGAVDPDRLTKSIDQTTLAYEFKHGKPKSTDAFDSSFLPPLAERRPN